MHCQWVPCQYSNINTTPSFAQLSSPGAPLGGWIWGGFGIGVGVRSSWGRSGSWRPALPKASNNGAAANGAADLCGDAAAGAAGASAGAPANAATDKGAAAANSATDIGAAADAGRKPRCGLAGRGDAPVGGKGAAMPEDAAGHKAGAVGTEEDEDATRGASEEAPAPEPSSSSSSSATSVPAALDGSSIMPQSAEAFNMSRAARWVASVAATASRACCASRTCCAWCALCASKTCCACRS